MPLFGWLSRGGPVRSLLPNGENEIEGHLGGAIREDQCRWIVVRISWPGILSDRIMVSSLSTLTPGLAERLERPLPGHDAHLAMAPQYPARQADLSVEDRACRNAGVLVLLLPPDNDPALVLTVRRDHLPDHAGQISFPGGQQEDNESLPETALREAEEEIALPSSSVQILGRLTPLYIPPSNFCVHPFVAGLDTAPDLHPTDDEVGHILRASLNHLLSPAARHVEPRTLNGTDVNVPYYDVSGHAVWGATAMMLSEFLTVVQEAQSTAE